MKYFKSYTKLKSRNLLFFTFLLVYGVILIYLCNKMNIWEDEAYSLITTSKGLAGVIRDSYHFEGQPPVYFILLSLWRLIYPGVFFSRLLSFLFIVFSAFIFYRIIQLVSDKEASKWLVTIFLLNPFTIWAILEIRGYSLIIFLSTLSIYFFIRYVIDNRKDHFCYFLFICLIGLYTQYFFAFLIAAIALTYLIFRGWRAFFTLCLYLIPVIILFLPNLYYLYGNLAMAHSDNPDYSMMQRITLPFNSVQNIVLGMNLIPYATVLRWSTRLIFIFLVSFSYLNLFRNRKIQSNSNFQKINAVLILSSFIVIFFTFYLVITGIKFNDRYFAVVFPIFMLFLIIFNNFPTILRNIIYGTISIFFIVLLFYKYSNPIKTYDYQAVANYIDKIERPNEAILLNSRTISVPFEYYYKGSSYIVPLPDTFKLNKDGFQVLIRSTFELKLLIGDIKSKSLLFINDNLIDYSANLKLTADIMDKCINENYTITLDTLFFGQSNRSALRIRRIEN